MNTQTSLVAYVLAKNEEPNIAKCLRSLQPCGIPVVLLDSGSTDRTCKIAQRFPFCEVRAYSFRSHTDAWNEITGCWHPPGEYVMILDADMEVTDALWHEIRTLLRGLPHVVTAPVQMYVEGVPLKHGSLYPPKPIVFQTGREYFLAKGHCSKLKEKLDTRLTRAKLIHNDLKPYCAYLMSQVRYGQLLYDRYQQGKVSLKDRVRANSVIMALLYPLASLFVRGGVFAGRLAAIYALDRAIAVLVQYRVVLAQRVRASQRAANERESQ